MGKETEWREQKMETLLQAGPSVDCAKNKESPPVARAPSGLHVGGASLQTFWGCMAGPLGSLQVFQLLQNLLCRPVRGPHSSADSPCCA